MNDYEEKEKKQVFVGLNGQITMFWSKISITREGRRAFFSRGFAGTKTIFLRHLTAVQFKEAGKFTNGFIQFVFPGSQEDKGGLFSAGKDENTVMFNKEQEPEFKKLYDIIVLRHDF